jgi:glycosyltransferase involved in cell wall biosynthesis
VNEQNQLLRIIPLISIIIPTLQEEKILARTLKQFSSSLRDKFRFEVIVSDGGSTDDSIRIAGEYSDKVIIHTGKSKQNISMGRNQGARAAQGAILIFLNADVIIEDPEKFLLQMLEDMRDGRIVAATCNVNIYPKEELIRDWVFHNFFNGYFWLLNILGMGMGRGECHVIRKDVFEKVDGYNETMAAGEDYELFLRLHRLGKIKFVRELTVFESPRRFRKYGYLWISILWFLNALSVFLFDRPMTDEWKPVR